MCGRSDYLKRKIVRAALVIKNDLDCKEDYTMNYSTEVKQKLLSIITEMDSYRWLFTKNPETDFSRKKKWSFEEIMKFMLTMEGKTLRDELLEYFDFDSSAPSNSAFNQRRAQILPEAFEFLFQEFTKSFHDNAAYKGFRLIACDGSDLCIANNPKDETTYFQPLPDSKGFNQLHLNAFYDLCSRRYTDAIIQPARLKNENSAMCELIDRYRGQPAVFIADRGYENYNIFAHAEHKGMYYLIRVKDVTSNGIASKLTMLPESDEFDEWVNLTLTKKQTNEVKANPQKYRIIMKKTPFDYLDLHFNKFYEMKMRVVRFPISQDSYECIITNLPQEKFSSDEIKQLYAKRWGIETSFRELKYALGLTRFHAKKTEYIMQEIWSRMTLYNFCEIIAGNVVVNQKASCKHIYQLNDTRAMRICCHFLSIKEEKAPPDVEYLIGHELLPVRSGRTDPRKVKPQSAISFLYRAA